MYYDRKDRHGRRFIRAGAKVFVALVQIIWMQSILLEIFWTLQLSPILSIQHKLHNGIVTENGFSRMQIHRLVWRTRKFIAKIMGLPYGMQDMMVQWTLHTNTGLVKVSGMIMIPQTTHFRDHVFAYPTSNGVIDTIQWEGWREGVDDTRYLATLIKHEGSDTSARAIVSDSLSKGDDMATIREKVIDQILITSPINNEQPKMGIYLNGMWYWDSNRNGVWDAGTDKAYNFGAPGWTSVVGDWNGDGKGTKIGIYQNGVWYLDYNGNGAWDAGTDKVFTFGTTGWTSVVGDWNGDGKTEVGIYQNGVWYLDWNGNGAWDAGTDKVYRLERLLGSQLLVTGTETGKVPR